MVSPNPDIQTLALLGRQVVTAINGGDGQPEIRAFLNHAEHLPPAGPHEHVRDEALRQVDSLQDEAKRFLSTLERGDQIAESELATFRQGVEDVAAASSRSSLPPPENLI